MTTQRVRDPAAGLDVRPMAGHIGAEIVGVDLREPLRPDEVAAVRAAWLRWKVVFFRDQALTQEQHLAFGRAFGEVLPGHPTIPAVFPEHPEILLLDNREQLPSNSEKRWHSDVSFSLDPPMAAVLRGVVIPPYGGDTQWVNTAAVYAALSPEIQDLIDRLHAVHHNEVPIARGERTAEQGEVFQSRLIRTVHPVVRVHPETGEKALFVNPLFTTHVVELSRREGRHLLAMLFEHLDDPEFSVRFRWQPDSVAFWDNRATVHRVPTDVPPEFHRSMQRIALAGDVPVDPDSGRSRALSA